MQASSKRKGKEYAKLLEHFSILVELHVQQMQLLVDDCAEDLVVVQADVVFFAFALHIGHHALQGLLTATVKLQHQMQTVTRLVDD